MCQKRELRWTHGTTTLCTMQIEGKRGGLPCLLAAATIQVGQTAAMWCYFKLLSPPKLSLCIYCHDKLFTVFGLHRIGISTCTHVLVYFPIIKHMNAYTCANTREDT